MYYIYKFTNKTNGKIYIGQTNNIQKRKNCHRSDSFNEKSSGYNLPFHYPRHQQIEHPYKMQKFYYDEYDIR